MHDGDPSPAVRFRWLDRSVAVAAPDDRWLRFVRRQWGESGDPGPAGLRYRIESDPDGTWHLRTPDARIRLDPDVGPLHAYHAVSRDLLGRTGERFVLHATAVARGDRALILSGPSTFGKTTLGVHLALRGALWLADDMIALSRQHRTVARFPRPLRLRPGTRSLLGSRDLARARESVLDRDGEDWIVDPETWLGRGARDLRCGWVVILRPADESHGLRRFPFYRVRPRSDLDARRIFDGLPASCRPVDDRPDLGDGSVLLEVGDVAEFSAWVDRRENDLLYVVKYPSSPAEFDGAATLSPISRFQAALELAQEMQNRHAGSVLARDYAGREVEMVLDLAEALGDARCYALAPGELRHTVAALEQLIGVPPAGGTPG